MKTPYNHAKYQPQIVIIYSDCDFVLMFWYPPTNQPRTLRVHCHHLRLLLGYKFLCGAALYWMRKKLSLYVCEWQQVIMDNVPESTWIECEFNPWIPVQTFYSNGYHPILIHQVACCRSVVWYIHLQNVSLDTYLPVFSHRACREKTRHCQWRRHNASGQAVGCDAPHPNIVRSGDVRAEYLHGWCALSLAARRLPRNVRMLQRHLMACIQMDFGIVADEKRLAWKNAVGGSRRTRSSCGVESSNSSVSRYHLRGLWAIDFRKDCSL